MARPCRKCLSSSTNGGATKNRRSLHTRPVIGRRHPAKPSGGDEQVPTAPHHRQQVRHRIGVQLVRVQQQDLRDLVAGDSFERASKNAKDRFLIRNVRLLHALPRVWNSPSAPRRKRARVRKRHCRASPEPQCNRAGREIPPTRVCGRIFSLEQERMPKVALMSQCRRDRRFSAQQVAGRCPQRPG